jgi:hypothetical protein
VAEAWGHVHFSVTACYQEPDGTQIAVPLRVNNGLDDFWLAATPEWVRVYQIGASQTVVSRTRLVYGVSPPGRCPGGHSVRFAGPTAW